MKKQIMAGIMAVMMVLTMMQTTAFAGSEKTMEPSTETMCGVSDDTPELSSSEEDVESGGKPGEADASFDTEDEQHAKTEESSETDSEKAKIDAAVGTKNDERVETEESSETDSATGKSDASLDIEDEEQVTTEESSETVSEVSEEALSEEDAIAPIAETNYEVSSDSELIDALNNIQASTETEATIVLKADVTVQSTSGGSYTASFGVTGKHITVKSDEGEMKKLSFLSYGVLNGDCTFDNVNVTGSRLFCNGYRTIFTENGQIHLSETLYGGGYKTTVNSTYVVIAASGYINPSSSSGLHDVIGGSYQGSVEGDTYLEITGDIQMQGGNHLNPGCMKGDGTSGDGRDVPDVYVGGNATLIYDNKNSTAASPAIEGTYGL